MKIILLFLISLPAFAYHSTAILDCRQSISSTEFMFMLISQKVDESHRFQFKKYENGEVVVADQDQVQVNTTKSKLEFHSKKMHLSLETSAERAITERYFIGDLTFNGEHYDVSCEYFIP